MCRLTMNGHRLYNPFFRAGQKITSPRSVVCEARTLRKVRLEAGLFDKATDLTMLAESCLQRKASKAPPIGLRHL